MIVRLKNGLKLELPEGTPLPLSTKTGFFILKGHSCDNPDLSITPAYYATCDGLIEVYELHQYEIVLGRPENIVD